MANRSVANKVKLLREQKAWSQSHLAEAAGLSVRTVQRLEKHGECSNETLLSVAAAFDVDVEDFTLYGTYPGSLQPEDQEQKNFNFSLRNWIKTGQSGWQKIMAFTGVGLLVLPVSFFSFNVLTYEFGFSAMFNPFDYLFQAELIRTISPVIFLGSLFMAGLLNLFPFIDLDIRQSEKGLLSSLHYRGNCWNGLILGVSFIVLALKVAYVAVENISEHAVQLSSALN